MFSVKKLIKNVPIDNVKFWFDMSFPSLGTNKKAFELVRKRKKFFWMILFLELTESNAIVTSSTSKIARPTIFDI